MADEYENVYMFLGHGWDTGKVFDVGNKRIKIIMLADPTLFMENQEEVKYMQLLMRLPPRPTFQQKLGYFDVLDDYVGPQGSVAHNRFTTYDSTENPLIPDLLLSVEKKINPYDNREEKKEICRLQELGKMKQEQIMNRYKTFMLSELVEQLGDNFILKLFVCRPPIDKFQVENIPTSFGETSTILQKINEAKLYQE